MNRGLYVSGDVLQTGFRTVQFPHPRNSYRTVSTSFDGLQIVLTKDELRELKRLLNEIDLE